VQGRNNTSLGIINYTDIGYHKAKGSYEIILNKKRSTCIVKNTTKEDTSARSRPNQAKSEVKGARARRKTESKVPKENRPRNASMISHAPKTVETCFC
jgi:hypothetical protein